MDTSNQQDLAAVKAKQGDDDMGSRSVAATLDEVVVYHDEPQVVILKSNGRMLVAVAIPDDDLGKAMFFAAEVTSDNWIRHLTSARDLRSLLAEPSSARYVFDLNLMSEKVVQMTPWTSEIPEAFLPAGGFFTNPV